MNYRERNNITRNDFIQLLIQIKNKVNLEDENEILEMNGQENLENKISESGMYSYLFIILKFMRSSSQTEI